MTIGRGRVVRAADLGEHEVSPIRVPILAPGASEPKRLRIAHEEVLAREAAARIRAAATADAEALVRETRLRAEAIAMHTVEETRAAEQAKFAALYVALRAEDERRAERDQDRAIALAIALAERIVGHALTLEPELIASLAKRALAEARGARKVLIEASPDDAPPLRTRLEALGLPDGAVNVVENVSLARGDLCLHTDLGTLHARITPQLERLAQALRDALRPA